MRGFADQRLRDLKDPLDPANRRISIIVQYINSTPDEAAETASEGTKKPGEEKPSAAGAKAEGEATGSEDKKQKK